MRFDFGAATLRRLAALLSNAGRRCMTGGLMNESRICELTRLLRVREPEGSSGFDERRLEVTETRLCMRECSELGPCGSRLMLMTLPGGEKGLSGWVPGVPGV